MNPSTRIHQHSSPFRRGSVLLMVVVLLLLMAILGTAYLSTTRVDRIASGGSLANTQIDELSNNARDTVIGAIVNSLFYYGNGNTAPTASRSFRFADGNTYSATYSPQLITSTPTQSYYHYDAPLSLATASSTMMGNDRWLADRVPTSPVGGGSYYWNAITQPLNAANQFESPDSGATYTPVAVAPGNPATVTAWTTVPQIASKSITFGTTTYTYPALTVNGTTYIAADADGDGIADSGLMRIPGIFADGLTYYMAVRIVDNNAAVNINTAWDYQTDYPFGATASPVSAFPTNVGLAQLLDPNAMGTTVDITGLNTYRFGPTSAGSSIGAGPIANQANSYSDTHAATTDYTYTSQEEALYSQLGRRIANPGLFSDGTNLLHYQAISEADGASLAYHFCLLNPTTGGATSTASTLTEQLLNNGAFLNAPNSGKTWSNYNTTAISTWYNDNFNFTAGSSTQPKNARPFLVAHNGISNFAPSITLTYPTITVPNTGMVPWGDRGRWQAGINYNVGDVVTYPLSPSGEQPYYFNEAYPDYFYCKTAQVSATANAPTGLGSDTNWSLTPTSGYTPPTSATGVRANINTATFPELFRAFWCVASFGAQTPPTGKKLPPAFANPVRDGSETLTAQQMAFLRAAIAATNAEALRAPDVNAVPGYSGPRTVPAHLVSLGNDAGGNAVNAVVYGVTPQPYITEVYIQTDNVTNNGGVNATGYCAVELYNPYPFDIPLSTTITGSDYSWQIGLLNRLASPTAKTLTTLQGFDGSTFPIDKSTNKGYPFVPANGYLLMENYTNQSGSTASYRPASSGLPPIGAIANTNQNPLNTSPTASSFVPRGNDAVTGKKLPQLNVLFVPLLANVVGNEMVLMKRRHGDGTTSAGTDPQSGYQWNDAITNPATAIYSFVPVDSFDFSAITAPTGGQAQELHYARASDPVAPGLSEGLWQFVYPGSYNVSGVLNGVATATFTAGGTDTWATTPPATFTLGANTANQAQSNASTIALPQVAYTIQLASQNWAGTNRPTPSANKFPFGGFARNGDILETSYIGSYMLYSSAGNLLEVNPVTMDSIPCPDGATNEQVGRFCPLIDQDGSASLPYSAQQVYDYDWTRHLFDFVTVQSPRDDYSPNVDPSLYPPNITTPGTELPVKNSNSAIVGDTDAENGELIQGLVNINTAPFAVLRTLPLAVDSATKKVNASINDTLAQAIVDSRTKYGPFTSIFDLNRVVNFQNGGGTITSTANFNGTSTYYQGDLANGDSTGAPSGIPNQFDETYLQVTRLSNLITTRSDVFTVYVDIEGWQNAGSTVPTLLPKRVVQRRTAFTVDRSAVSPVGPPTAVSATQLQAGYPGVRTVTIPNN